MFRNFKFYFKKRKGTDAGSMVQQEKNYDPVCGMLATGDFFVINYQEQDYYFCSEYCKDKFAADPFPYLS